MDFSSAIGNAEWWRDLGFSILVYGLFAEIIGLTIPKERGRFEKIWSAAATLVIVIGVLLEHRADNRISEFIAQQKTAADIETAQIRERAARLEKEAAILRQGVSARWVSPATREQLKSRFAGHHVPSFQICIPNDFEAFLYGQELASQRTRKRGHA